MATAIGRVFVNDLQSPEMLDSETERIRKTDPHNL